MQIYVQNFKAKDDLKNKNFRILKTFTGVLTLFLQIYPVLPFFLELYVNLKHANFVSICSHYQWNVHVKRLNTKTLSAFIINFLKYSFYYPINI